MKNLLKNILCVIFVFARDVLDPIFHFQEISILCYHSVGEKHDSLSVSAAAFERQMKYLAENGYHFVCLAEVMRFVDHDISIPEKSVAVTFDDGYEDNYLVALPIFKKYKIPATVFVVADWVNTQGRLSSEQIAAMESELIAFQDHSKSHKLLDQIPAKEVEKELSGAQEYQYFAYPGGHYSRAVMNQVEDAGYEAAFSIKPGLVKRLDDVFLMKRNVITGDMPFVGFRLRTTKAIDWYVKIKRFLYG